MWGQRQPAGNAVWYCSSSGFLLDSPAKVYLCLGYVPKRPDATTVVEVIGGWLLTVTFSMSPVVTALSVSSHFPKCYQKNSKQLQKPNRNHTNSKGDQLIPDPNIWNQMAENGLFGMVLGQRIYYPATPCITLHQVASYLMALHYYHPMASHHVMSHHITSHCMYLQCTHQWIQMWHRLKDEILILLVSLHDQKPTKNSAKLHSSHLENKWCHYPRDQRMPQTPPITSRDRM